MEYIFNRSYTYEKIWLELPKYKHLKFSYNIKCKIVNSRYVPNGKVLSGPMECSISFW